MKRIMLFPLSLSLIFAATVVAAKTKDDVVHAAEVASANAATFDQRISNGEKLFVANCAACHQVTGKGLPGAFPPLVASDYFADDPMKAVLAVLLVMTRSNIELLLSYVRRHDHFVALLFLCFF